MRSRRAVERLYENKAQLNSISMHLGESVGKMVNKLSINPLLFFFFFFFFSKLTCIISCLVLYFRRLPLVNQLHPSINANYLHKQVLISSFSPYY